MGLFTSANNISLKKLRKIADQVIALDEKYTAMTDEELQNQTNVLKERLRFLIDVPSQYSKISSNSGQSFIIFFFACSGVIVLLLNKYLISL